MKKVIITRLPKYAKGGAFRTFGPQTPPQDNTVTPGKGFSDNRSTPEIKVNRTLKPVPREEANLEAEKGETVVTSLNDDGIPEFYNISGKSHSRGGTPLNLPEHSFIYSRSKDLLVKNPDIQKYFGMSPKKSGYTPADISKNFNLNKYREILADPTTDKLQRETAELMIKNYVGKLGALALAQEAAKGFQEGIPSIAGPFMEKMGIDPNALAGQQEQQQQPMQMSKYGGRTLRKAFWGNTGMSDEEFQDELEAIQKEKDEYGIGTEIKSRQRIFGEGTLTGPEGLISDAVGMLTYLGKTKGYDPLKTESQTWGTNQAMTFGSNRGFDNQPLQGTPSDPTRMTPIQYGFDTFADPSFGNVFAEYGGSTPRTLRRFDNGGGVGEKDVKLKKGDKVIHIPGTGYAIVDNRGNFKGYIDAEENELSGTNADPNNSRVEHSSRPTTSVNIPKGAVKWDPSKEGFDQSKVQIGHYIKRKDGRWYKVTGAKVSPYEGRKLETLDDRLGQYKEAYGRLEHKIMSSPDLQKALVKQYRDLIAQVKPKGRMSAADIEKARNMSDEEIINNYLRAEKQVMMINASDPGIGQRDDKDTWDRGWDSNAGVPREYAKKSKELGITPLSIPQTIAFQTAYIGMQKLYDSGEYSKELQDFKPLSKTQVGFDDEGKGLAEGHATISDVDGWWGNTTTGQAQLYSPFKQELDYEAVEEIDDGYEHLEDFPPGTDLSVGPFPEDRRNLNYATWATFARRKGQPALVQPAYYEAQPQFSDFFAPASRMAGQALNLATDNPYLTGQRYGSVASSLTPVEGILQAQEQANRFNIATENQFRQANAAARNQHSALRAGNLKRYLDEVEQSNEMANRELIAGVGLMNAMRNQLTTNWRNINLTNEMSDDFAIDPNDILNPVKKKYNPVPITPKDKYDNLEAVAEGANILRSYQPGLSEDKAMELATKLITGQDVSNSGWNQMPGMNVPYIDPSAYGLNT